MYLPKQRRKRGVVLTLCGLQKLQAAKSQVEAWENAGRRYSLEALSLRTGLDRDTLIKIFDGQSRVDKRTLSRCFKAFNLLLEFRDYQHSSPCEVVEQPKAQAAKAQINLDSPIPILDKDLPVNGPTYIDWNVAPDVSEFCGRDQELATLNQWLVNDRCRLVLLLGMGGIGKTWLSVKLAKQLQDQFDIVIWRSLQHAPPVDIFLAQMIQVLSCQRKLDLAGTINDQIVSLIGYLRSTRCLIILDNIETLLQSGETSSDRFSPGCYRSGYEAYGELLKRIGETTHQSCIILTSREKPKEIRYLAGESLPVRVLPIKGLQFAEAKKHLLARSTLHGTQKAWCRLIEYYLGNPLILKLIARTIHDVFDSSIDAFLHQKATIFGDIHDLLKQQFQRLSEPEREVIALIASQNQALSFTELRSRINPEITSETLLEAIESLKEHSLIGRATSIELETKVSHFTLQPILTDYIRVNPAVCSQLNGLEFKHGFASPALHSKSTRSLTQAFQLFQAASDVPPVGAKRLKPQ